MDQLRLGFFLHFGPWTILLCSSELVRDFQESDISVQPKSSVPGNMYGVLDLHRSALVDLVVGHDKRRA